MSNIIHLYICSDLHSGVDSCVCSNTEVCPWHIVTYSGRYHTHDYAELIIMSPCLHQLENSLIRLWELDRGNRHTCTHTHTSITIKTCLQYLYLKSTDNQKRLDAVLGKIFHNFFHAGVWQGSKIKEQPKATLPDHYLLHKKKENRQYSRWRNWPFSPEQWASLAGPACYIMPVHFSHLRLKPRSSSHACKWN